MLSSETPLPSVCIRPDNAIPDANNLLFIFTLSYSTPNPCDLLDAVTLNNTRGQSD